VDGQHAVGDVDRLHIVENICLAVHPADGDHQLLAHSGTAALAEAVPGGQPRRVGQFPAWWSS
jgi:hypothetical protein